MRIVALTAHASGVERERCLAAGMNDYLSKPFRPHDLFAIIEEGVAPAEVSAPPAGAVAPPVDLAAFRATMREAGAEAAVDGIVAMFAGGAPDRLAAVSTAVEGGDGGAIERAAHAFRSSAATIGASALAERLGDIERAGRGGVVERATSQLSALRGDVDAVLTYLRSDSERAVSPSSGPP